MTSKIFSHFCKASMDGTPIGRALFFEFPSDENTYLIDDQFMLGEKFLVAPVLKKGAKNRNIYLPAGTWIDFWNGQIFKGGKWMESYPAPLDVLPIFIKVL